tara:strand:- start:77 stop:1069 length:993 start_codon:yes stop_codon:yes gene_type:complete
MPPTPEHYHVAFYLWRHPDLVKYVRASRWWVQHVDEHRWQRALKTEDALAQYAMWLHGAHPDTYKRLAYKIGEMSQGGVSERILRQNAKRQRYIEAQNLVEDGMDDMLHHVASGRTPPYTADKFASMLASAKTALGATAVQNACYRATLDKNLTPDLMQKALYYCNKVAAYRDPWPARNLAFGQIRGSVGDGSSGREQIKQELEALSRTSRSGGGSARSGEHSAGRLPLTEMVAAPATTFVSTSCLNDFLTKQLRDPTRLARGKRAVNRCREINTTFRDRCRQGNASQADFERLCPDDAIALHKEILTEQREQREHLAARRAARLGAQKK